MGEFSTDEGVDHKTTMISMCSFNKLASTATILSSIFLSADCSFPKIAGYEPGSDVTEHNKLDLDMAEMMTHLGTQDWTAAEKIYRLGGNSGAKATFTIPAPAVTIEKGVAVTQADNPNNPTGYVKSECDTSCTSLQVTITSTCKEGGLATQDTSGCYSATDDLTIDGVTHTPTAVANTYRNLKGFSTAADSKMSGQVHFLKFRSYYGNAGDYGDKVVMAALSDVPTDFDGDGNQDALDVSFTNDGSIDLTDAASKIAARKEISKKAAAYMNVWMYTIREMEDAIDDCTRGCINCNDDPVHAWDEAVAFYTGTLEGTVFDSDTSRGKMLYNLADKRCGNFGTCNADGTSKVNEKIFDLFNQGKTMLQRGDCTHVRVVTDLIVQQMTVPLIQGTLRYAYKMDHLQGGAKELAEGFAFSSAVVPMVAACSRTDANAITDALSLKRSNYDDIFATVKTAFENNYECLNVTCTDVGELLDGDAAYSGAEKCTFLLDREIVQAVNDDDDGLATWAIGLIAACSLVALSAVMYIVRLIMREKAGKPLYFSQVNPPKEDAL